MTVRTCASKFSTQSDCKINFMDYLDQTFQRTMCLLLFHSDWIRVSACNSIFMCHLSVTFADIVMLWVIAAGFHHLLLFQYLYSCILQFYCFFLWNVSDWWRGDRYCTTYVPTAKTNKQTNKLVSLPWKRDL